MARVKEVVKSLEARIGAQIRALRKAKGLTQAQLAELSSVDNMTISRLENGVRSPTVEHLVKLAEILEAPVSRLLGENASVISTEALALADALKGLDNDQIKFVFEFILLYKQTHSLRGH